MKTYQNTIIYLNSFFILTSCHVNSDYDAPQEIQFFHDIGYDEEATWIEKDTVKLHNINSVVSQPQISPDIMEKLEDVNYSGAFYKLKSVVKTAKGRENVFYSFLKMDAYANAGFLTSTVVHLDQSGSVICVKLYPKKINDLSTQLIGYNSTVTFKGSEQGPLPDLTSYLLKLERERDAKEKGITQDNRSFLAKYWMYIVPILMFAILTGSNGDGGSQQQSR